MFTKHLRSLIYMSVKDGILDEKEREAIYNHAKRDGVDLAELEIFINSALQEVREKKEGQYVQMIDELFAQGVDADQIENIVISKAANEGVDVLRLSSQIEAYMAKKGITSQNPFVTIIQEYLKHSNLKKWEPSDYWYKDYKKDNGWEERDDNARAILEKIKSYIVPTEKTKLDRFCLTLEGNLDYLKEVCDEKRNYFLKDELRNIIKKTDNAYDVCYKNYKRTPTEEEQNEINRIAELEKSGKPEDLITIANFYPKYTEIQKWGSQKGNVDINPVAQVVLKVFDNIEVPKDKEALTAFMEEIIAQKDHLRQLSKSHKLLNYKGRFGSNNLYNYLIGKGDEIIDMYYKDETEGFIGERNGKKAQNKKYLLYGAIVAVVLIILLFLFL